MEEGVLIGAALGVVLVTLFSDFLGRIRSIKLGIILLIMAVLITLLGSVDWVRFIGFLLWGIGAQKVFLITLTLISDIMSR